MGLTNDLKVIGSLQRAGLTLDASALVVAGLRSVDFGRDRQLEVLANFGVADCDGDPIYLSARAGSWRTWRIAARAGRLARRRAQEDAQDRRAIARKHDARADEPGRDPGSVRAQRRVAAEWRASARRVRPVVTTDLIRAAARCEDYPRGWSSGSGQDQSLPLAVRMHRRDEEHV